MKSPAMHTNILRMLAQHAKPMRSGLAYSGRLVAIYVSHLSREKHKIPGRA